MDLLDRPVPKHYTVGTHRLRPPAETVLWVRRFAPPMGITRVANVTGLDNIGIPVVMVCRPNSRTLAVAQGKGLDLPSAQAAGLLESIEAYHAERISLPLKLASLEELRYTHQVADVELLPRSQSDVFHPFLPVHWIEGHDLLNDQHCWLPFDLVHTNFTVGMRSTASGFLRSSNGLASGNHLLEAISHALCEVIERDAATLWLLRPDVERARTRLELSTIDDDVSQSVLDKYARADVAVGVWDLTSDVGLPVFLCRIVDLEPHPFRRQSCAEGMGCHPLREVALLRALTEAAQSRLTTITGSRDDYLAEERAMASQPDLVAQRRDEILEQAPQRSFSEVPTWPSETFNDDVRLELDRLASVGCERVLMVDLTRAEFRIPVVRVVVSGLESWAGAPDYVPGNRALAYADA